MLYKLAMKITSFLVIKYCYRIKCWKRYWLRVDNVYKKQCARVAQLVEYYLGTAMP